MPSIRIRGRRHQKREPYPLNDFPEQVIEGIGKRLVHRLAVGHLDINGDDFSRIFADSIGGVSLARPLGVADVTWDGCAWSVKTVQNSHPHKFWVNEKGDKKPKRVRLISGRNSVAFSAGIQDPLTDPQATGNAVLEIYNERIYDARKDYDDVRMLVFVRNMDKREFSMFEQPVTQLIVNDFSWIKNKQNNLEGFTGDVHHFTWQPHGSQFTIIKDMPHSSIKWKINQTPPIIDLQSVLDFASYEKDWIEIVD